MCRQAMLPSTRHLFVAILFAAIYIMATREISDPDFWWHLRTGKYILETGSIPHTDVFSFTSSGKEWVTHEWLSEILIYTLFRAGGFTLLIIIFAGIITAAFAIVYFRSPARPFLAGFVVLGGALATMPTWGVRPQMLSLLLTSVFLFLLDRYQDYGDIRFVIPLVPLTILWVNLHSGFALGLVLVAVYIIGIEIEPREPSTSQTNDHRLRNLIIIFILCLLTVMANPNGARMYSYPIETLTSPTMQRYIQEWFSPDFHQIEFQPFALLLIALIASALWARARMSATAILLAVIFGYASLRSARNIPIFALVAVPILTRQLAEGLRAHGWLRVRASLAPPPRALGFLNAALLFALLGVVSLRVYEISENQMRVEQAKFPAKAASLILDQKPAPYLYNSYAWGGYLIWRLYPEYRVFIDGRADVYGDRFIEDFLRIYRAEPGWNDQLSKVDVRLVLVEPDSPLALALASSSSWDQVYADDHSALFERK
jgi:hypothetical protein